MLDLAEHMAALYYPDIWGAALQQDLHLRQLKNRDKEDARKFSARRRAAVARRRKTSNMTPEAVAKRREYQRALYARRKHDLSQHSS